MSTIDRHGRSAGRRAGERALADDRARAERVAAERRRRTQLQNLVIRLVSLAIALALWQIAGANIDPVLFTTPIQGRGRGGRHGRGAASCGPICGRA